MRLRQLLIALLIPAGLAGCVAPGPGYYGRPGGYYGGGPAYRAPAYGGGYGYGGGYRAPAYVDRSPRPSDNPGWGGGQRQAPPQARGSGSPEIDRAIAIARQRQPQQNPPTQ
jgi:hypothetical protein